MNKYRVTRGDVSRDIEAANEAEARRKFDAPEITTNVEVIEGNLAPPPKNLYRVTWGPDVREVVAVHEDDAWSQFVGGDEDSIAYKYPQTYQRVVENLGPVETDQPESQPTDEAAADQTSPVASMDAAEAKDHISRMRSQEQLRAIAASEKRATVAKAAETRLAELGGNQ